MRSVMDHYKNHPAPIYVWMAGGFEAAIARGKLEVDAACTGAVYARPSLAPLAVDLGAGFGMHTLPLADIGYAVVAIDSSDTLLDVLDSHVGAQNIRSVRQTHPVSAASNDASTAPRCGCYAATGDACLTPRVANAHSLVR